MRVRRVSVMSFCLGLLIQMSCRPAQVPLAGPQEKRESRSLEERKATDLATEFLAKEGILWGEPTRVHRAKRQYVPEITGDSAYVVTYVTPPDELKRLGHRAVVVDIMSGRVRSMPRD